VLRNFAQTIPDFINGIDPSETLAQHFLCGAHDRWPKCPYASMAFCFDDLKAPA
jgi:hypothetical protein